ncbi:GFA family protein [Marinicella gelatinilytica]|uniref:GFA family protein n=1 Tax=Marinicella gelatinilytica TaxID=2996017 RepID=UPI002260F2E2|nr:hypothetical protein [Marinicella gelatinilytica]MCX7544173.1 hypothetical protein [Marinicella gelatinilytica]
MTNNTALSCQCGQVTIQVQAQPILSAACLCTECQQAGEFLQSLPGAPEVLDEYAATRFVLYRKDRMRLIKGHKYLREHRLTKDTETRRVIATCCNTPLFLEFIKGHWLSLYGVLWPADGLPKLELRTMTKDKKEDIVLADDVPNPKTHTLTFYAKLLFAWLAMGFRSPKIDYVQGTLNAEKP